MSSEQVVEVGDKHQTHPLTSVHAQLDALWVRYLNLLDEYTNARAAIKKHLSSGYFTLAQANFKSSRGRYGQDYYDQRAVATTRVKIAAKDESVSFKVQKSVITTDEQTVEDASAEKSSGDENENAESPANSDQVQLPTPEATPEPETKHSSSTSEAADMKKDSTPDQEEPKPQIDPHDPIRWFGILVPSTLRQAQKSFAAAVLDEGSVRKAVNSARGMREIEVEIRKLRKAIKKEDKKAGEALPTANVVKTIS